MNGARDWLSGRGRRAVDQWGFAVMTFGAIGKNVSQKNYYGYYYVNTLFVFPIVRKIVDCHYSNQLYEQYIGGLMTLHHHKIGLVYKSNKLQERVKYSYR